MGTSRGPENQESCCRSSISEEPTVRPLTTSGCVLEPRIRGRSIDFVSKYGTNSCECPLARAQLPTSDKFAGMGQRLCRSCANAAGIYRPIYSDPLGSTGQRASHLKHTRCSTVFEKQGVFDSDSTSYWRDTQNEALARGFFEVDDLGRPRFVHVPSAGSRIGGVNQKGREIYQGDAVVAVNPWTSTGAHIFPEGSSRWSGLLCDRCGGSLIK